MGEHAELDQHVASAVLGIDTLWGGDVMSPSGAGRFIADSWFSDAPLPVAYSHEAAARLRAAGGMSADEPDLEAVDAYLRVMDLPAHINATAAAAAGIGGQRGAFLAHQAISLEVMWDLAMELLGRGEPVGYGRSVRAATGADPRASDVSATLVRLAELLTQAGYPVDRERELRPALDAWRSARTVSMASLPALSSAFIAELDGLTAANIMPHLPPSLQDVPRANICFKLLEGAMFSGAMSYVGRARRADGSPEYEAVYEINASLEMSIPELQELISHEVVPGHVTTVAFLQKLHVDGEIGFEATVLAMNTPMCTLSEGIANNAMQIAHGVTELHDLPDRDVEIAMLLNALQDGAKNQAAYLTWQEGWPKAEVAEVLRRDFAVTGERADKLSGPWAHHPILGRMYLPAYQVGTELVARLRRQHAPEKVLPALFGCRGLVDAVTIVSVL